MEVQKVQIVEPAEDSLLELAKFIAMFFKGMVWVTAFIALLKYLHG